MPAVGVPRLYTSYGALFDACVFPKPVMLASAGPALQLVLLAMTRTLLVDAKPNPASCNEHEAVKKHEVV
jgi:hypothetical protein